jgi:hypothetical protein
MSWADTHTLDLISEDEEGREVKKVKQFLMMI